MTRQEMSANEKIRKDINRKIKRSVDKIQVNLSSITNWVKDLHDLVDNINRDEENNYENSRMRDIQGLAESILRAAGEAVCNQEKMLLSKQYLEEFMETEEDGE